MFLSPAQIVESLNLKKGDTVADFGCGSGAYVFAISKLIGDRGKVYAVDIHAEILDKINREAEKMNIVNIDTILADIEEKIQIENSSCNAIILSNILSDIKDFNTLFSEIKRILKPGGFLIVVDWKESDHPLYTKRINTITEENLTAILALNNFYIKKHLPAGLYHYAFLVEQK